MAAEVERLEDRTLLSIAAFFDSTRQELMIDMESNEDVLVTATGAPALVQILTRDVPGGPFNVPVVIGTGSLLTTDVVSIAIRGGDGANEIDLSGVTAADYVGPLSISVESNDGNDTIHASEFGGVYSAGNGDDLLVGGTGDDTLDGGDGNDTILGNDGNDSLRGQNGVDSIAGGDGNDFADGGDGPDSIDGGDGADKLLGNAGDDTLGGGAGDDTLNGGAGLDVLGGGDDDDRLLGGGDNDSLDGDAGNDTLKGQGGNDSLDGGTGDDLVDGAAGNDSIFGAAGDDTLRGHAGDDTLDGGADNDALNGNGGDDWLLGGDGNDKLRGGAGRDTLNGGTGDDTVRGQGGADTVYGGSGADLLDGGVGDDHLESAFPGVSISDAFVIEGNADEVIATFTVTLSARTARTVTVEYATQDNTALVADGDYVAVSGMLTFPPLVTTQTIQVPVLGDTVDEGDESFFVVLTNPTNAELADDVGVGFIQNDDIATVSISDVVVNVEGDTGTVSADFTVTLSLPTSTAVTVEYATSPGTATPNADYQSTFGSVTFPTGVQTRTISILVNGDTVNEADETFFVDLFNATTVFIADGQGEATIVDDDPLPLLRILNVRVEPEGRSGTKDAVFTVWLADTNGQPVLSGQPVSVDLATADGTATAGADYIGTSATVVFDINPETGLTSSPFQTVAVPVIGDEIPEDDETFDALLSNPVNATILDPRGIGTIADSKRFVQVVLIVDESGSMDTEHRFLRDFIPSLDQGLLDAGIGIGLNANEYGLTGYGGGGSIIAGHVIPVGGQPFGTATEFATATSQLVLTGGTEDGYSGIDTALTNYPLQAAADKLFILVADEDRDILNPALTFATTEAALQAADVTLHGILGIGIRDGMGTTALAVAADGTAFLEDGSGGFTTSPGGTVIFGAGTTIPDYVDMVFDLDGLVGDLNQLRSGGLTADSFSAALVYALVGSLGTLPMVSITDATVNSEGNGGTTNADFTVTLSSSFNTPVEVNYVTTNGTASAAFDYQPTFGRVTFDPGTTTGTISIPVNGDLLDEDDETFFVTITNVTNATVADGSGQAVITDDDVPPTLTVTDVTIVPERAVGSRDAVFTLSLSEPSGRPVAVDFAAVDGTATGGEDFQSTPGTLVFPPGETVRTIAVPILGDTVQETAETFTLQLSNPVDIVLASTQATGTIIDDDVPLPPELPIAFDLEGDTLRGGTGNDTILGADGDDVLSGGSGADSIDGDAGNDSLSGGGGPDTLFGNMGDDTLRGQGAADVIFGDIDLRDPEYDPAIHNGFDVIIWNSGDGGDTIDGGLGFDDLQINTGSENDTVVATVDGTALVVTASTAADPAGQTIRSESLEKLTVNTNKGADVVRVENLVDLSLLQFVEVNGGGGADMVDASAQRDAALWVLLNGGNGSDTLLGGGGREMIHGDAGNDSLSGDAGNDTLLGGVGRDTLFGGNGHDDLNGGEDGDLLQGEAGNDTLDGGEGDDEIFGGSGNDSLLGNSGNDRAFGGIGNDTLDGSGGDDTLDGGEGDDLLRGQAGADSLLGNSGNDTLTGGIDGDRLSGGDGNDLLLGELGDDHLNGNAGSDTLSGGFGNDTLLGGSGDDELAGDADNDTLNGNSGDDSIRGGDGEDSLRGGLGDDTLNGGDDDDTLLGEAGNDALAGHDGQDVLNGGGDSDTLVAGDGHDTLRGGAGADYLIGNSGDDDLDGQGGVDTLSSGQGTDTVTGVAEDVIDESIEAFFDPSNPEFAWINAV